jgi:hypothetical protein
MGIWRTFRLLGIFCGNLVYFDAIWYILWSFGIHMLWPFGIFCGHLVYLFCGQSVYLFCGHLVNFFQLVYFVVVWYIFPFWYIVPRKIWQSCTLIGLRVVGEKKRSHKRVSIWQLSKKIFPPFLVASNVHDNGTGLPDYSRSKLTKNGKNVRTHHKLYQTPISYTKRP